MGGMETVEKINGIGLAIGTILGYLAIISGVIVTILILDTIFFTK